MLQITSHARYVPRICNILWLRINLLTDRLTTCDWSSVRKVQGYYSPLQHEHHSVYPVRVIVAIALICVELTYTTYTTWCIYFFRKWCSTITPTKPQVCYQCIVVTSLT